MTETPDTPTGNGHSKTIKDKVTGQDGSFWFRISMWLLGIISTISTTFGAFVLNDIRSTQEAFNKKLEEHTSLIADIHGDVRSLRTFAEGIDYRTSDITARFNKKVDEGVFAPRKTTH